MQAGATAPPPMEASPAPEGNETAGNMTAGNATSMGNATMGANATGAGNATGGELPGATGARRCAQPKLACGRELRAAATHSLRAFMWEAFYCVGLREERAMCICHSPAERPSCTG